jgi:lipopolysaccharide transport system ATP-binding protein
MDFQKKCLVKMESVQKGGRTILFVSHNMDLISKLCSSAILLAAGHVQAMGKVDEVTRNYVNQASASSLQFLANNEKRALQGIWLDDGALTRERLVIRIRYRFAQKVANPTFGIVIYTEGGSPIFGSNTMYHSPESDKASQQEGEATVTFEHFPVWSGCYRISVWLTDGWAPVDYEEYALTFEFVSSSAPINAPPARYVGPVHQPANWSFNA